MAAVERIAANTAQAVQIRIVMIEILLGIVLFITYLWICFYNYMSHKIRITWLKMVYPCMYLSFVAKRGKFRDIIEIDE